MRCETETRIGVTDSLENVYSLEKIGEEGGFWISGVQWESGDTGLRRQLQRHIGLHLGAKVLFVGKDGKEFRYEIKTKADTLRIINEVNFLLDLEKV
jgi:hypothetical protein